MSKVRFLILQLGAVAMALAVSQPTIAENYFSLATPGFPPSQISFQLHNPYPESLLKPGDLDAWDFTDVLNPDVIRWKGKYWNYYSGYNGEIWSTGLATSDNGIHWMKYEMNPILTPSKKGWDSYYIAANGSSIVHENEIYMFYQGANNSLLSAIGFATSKDGYMFQKHPKPILSPSPTIGSWDEKAVSDPFVIKHKNQFYLYYLGMNNVGIQRLGIASSDNGIDWVKHPGNPILDVGSLGSFDERGLGEPAVVFVPPFFYMIYTGRNSQEERNLGVAFSRDGINWRKVNSNGIVEKYLRGNWNNKIICDPEPVLVGDQMLIFYGGGNRAEPAQNLNGQIGAFALQFDSTWEKSSFSCSDNWTQSRLAPSEVFHGLYDIETRPNGCFAWADRKSSIYLLREPEHYKLRVDGYMPLEQFRKLDPDLMSVSITVRLDGELIHRESYTEKSVINLSLPLPLMIHGDDATFQQVELEVDKVIPSDNHDKRSRGVILSYVGFE
jgi:predicted GH43/DUF377 family glycosyl hydrolase